MVKTDDKNKIKRFFMSFMKNISSLIFLVVIGLGFMSCTGKAVVKDEPLATLEAQSNNPVIFVCDNYPPYYYLNEKKEVVGKSVAVLKKMAENLDLTPTFQCLPWNECLEKGKRGIVDGVVSLSKTKMREFTYYFPRVNLALSKWVIFNAPDYKGEGISSIEDLKGKRVGIVEGVAYPEKFMKYQDCQKITAKSTVEAMKWLANGNGKVDLVVEDVAVGKYILNYLKKSDDYPKAKMIEVAPLILKIDPIYIGIPKLSSHAKELYQKIDEELLEMQNSGEIFRISSKYEKDE